MNKSMQELVEKAIETECKNFICEENKRCIQDLLLYVEENRDSLLARMMTDPVNLKFAANLLGLKALGFISMQ